MPRPSPEPVRAVPSRAGAPGAAVADPEGTLDLCDLPPRIVADVVRLRFEGPVDGDRRQLALRLAEMGFSPGEQVVVTALGSPGREPLCVRVGGHGGHSRFGLRRSEAELVRVLPLEPAGAHGR